ncbi:hypothetical protein [Mycetohabitans endofungorum]|uniref:hypothetical protein n=1 Tax=Mycetohabitans endofungorum TaxID=417203 RepID=UPI002B058B3D|nr:hypothetical protein [Mycetohabitans endofungorum]
MNPLTFTMLQSVCGAADKVMWLVSCKTLEPCARRAQDDADPSFADRFNPISLATLVGNKALVRATKRDAGRSWKTASPKR